MDTELVERQVLLPNDRLSASLVAESNSEDARRVLMAFECLRFLITAPFRPHHHPTTFDLADEISNLTNLAKPQQHALWLGDSNCFVVARTTRRGGRGGAALSDSRCRYLFTIHLQLRTGDCNGTSSFNGYGSTCASHVIDYYHHAAAPVSSEAPANESEAAGAWSGVDQLFFLLGWAVPYLQEVDVLVEGTDGGDVSRSARVDGAFHNDSFPLTLGGVRDFCFSASRASKAAPSGRTPVAVGFQVPIGKMQWRTLFAYCPRNVQLVLGSCSDGSDHMVDRMGRNADEDASTSLQTGEAGWSPELALAFRQYCTPSDTGEPAAREGHNGVVKVGGHFSREAPQSLWLDLRDVRCMDAVLRCLIKPNQIEPDNFRPCSHPLRELVISWPNLQGPNADDYDDEESLILQEAFSPTDILTDDGEGGRAAVARHDLSWINSYALFIRSLPDAFPGLEILDLRHLPTARSLAEWNLILQSIGRLPALRRLHLGSVGRGRNWYRQQERNDALVRMLHSSGSAEALIELTYDDNVHQSIQDSSIRSVLEHNQFRSVVQRIKSWNPNTSGQASSSISRLGHFLETMFHSPSVHSNLSCTCLLLMENSDVLAQLAVAVCNKGPSITEAATKAITITTATKSGHVESQLGKKTSRQTALMDVGSESVGRKPTDDRIWSCAGEKSSLPSSHSSASPSGTPRALRAFHRMMPC
jgi:hypothetical protein